VHERISRAGVLGAGAAAAFASALAFPAAAAVPYGKPETPNLKIGIPLDATSYLPLYIAAQSTWKDAGLNVQLLAFRGDAESSQALAGDSIDLNCGSVTGLVNLITSGQGAIGVFAGFNLAGFSWYGQPGMKSWNDVRGKALGVSTFGSTTDALTRYVLRKHGLDPERDAHLIPVGNNVNQYQALKANRTQVAMLSAPATWQAESDGFPLLGTQQHEVANEWPEHIYAAKAKFIAANRSTIAAVLRGHVAALRFAKADRAAAVAVFVDRLKYTPALASRSYDELMPTYDERGRLPDRSMKVFWDILVRNGDVKAPLPDNAILDRQFVDSFAAWAPEATHA
jgi:ABC-type nitrate/sulfonate/bicarbonate transport system substrate-binding protein